MGEFVPLYRQVSQRIFRKIQQGVYKYGDKIPSEKELAAYYGVNRMTVRRAVSLLSEQGILKSMQGKGVFVVDTFYQARIPKDGMQFDGSFFQDPRLRQEFLFLQKVAAGKTLGDLFNIKGNSPVWLLGRLLVAENMVVALEYSYFPVKWIPDFSQGSLYGVLGNIVYPTPADAKPHRANCSGSPRLWGRGTNDAGSQGSRRFSGQSAADDGRPPSFAAILKFSHSPKRLCII